MSEPFPIWTAKNGFWLLLLLVAAGLAFLAPRAAVNVDEQLHYPHAQKVVNWYLTGGKDDACLNTPHSNLKYYGQSPDNFTALINRIFHVKKPFLVRHCTGALFFWLLLLFAGLLSRRITNSWITAIVTVLALIFMPRLAGQAFGNLKDIPFAAGYMAGLLMIIQFLKELPTPRWKTALLLGAAIAFSVSVRAGGFILFAYLGLGLAGLFVLKPFYLKQIVSTKPVFVRLLGQGAAILFIGYFAGLLFWPFALQNVLEHPLESLRVMEHYKVSIRQLFEGQMLWSTGLPWYYLPRWLLISTPVFILTGGLLFITFFLRDLFSNSGGKPQLFYEGLTLFAFAFPFLYVIAIEANLYSGVRQMLFIFPPLAIIAVQGTSRFLRWMIRKNRPAAWACSALLSLLLIAPLKHQATTFPTDYVYFNPLAGGNQKAWSNFEYDYYFHGVKEAAEDAIELAEGKKVKLAMNSNLSNYFEDHSNIRYCYTRFLERSSCDWDIGVFGINYIHPHLLKNDHWKPAETIKTYYHKGNPVAVLVKRTDKSGFYGISEIKTGNLKAGIALLEKRIEKDPENVWLYVYMGKAMLALGEKARFEHYLEQGKKIHPFFEPFFLLEAARLSDEGKYTQSLEKLQRLFEINPRYLPAKELYADVKAKIN